jgi:hypothetical protein
LTLSNKVHGFRGGAAQCASLIAPYGLILPRLISPEFLK